MDLIFAIGFQKYFLDQVKHSPEQLEYRNLFRSMIRDSRNNYVFFINYAFTPEEYLKRGFGLPECILGSGDSTFIPQEVHMRQKIGNICISHLSGSDIFTYSNPNIEGILLDIEEVCERINADKKTFKDQKTFESAMTESTDDKSLLKHFGERTQVGKKGNQWTPLENMYIFSWTQQEQEKIGLINGLTNMGFTKKYKLILQN